MALDDLHYSAYPSPVQVCFLPVRLSDVSDPDQIHLDDEERALCERARQIPTDLWISKEEDQLLEEAARVLVTTPRFLKTQTLREWGSIDKQELHDWCLAVNDEGYIGWQTESGGEITLSIAEALTNILCSS